MTSKSGSEFIKVMLKYVHQFYGLRGKIKNLAGYDDLNFLLKEAEGQEFVVKISQGDSLQALLSQNQLLDFIQEHSAESRAFPRILAGLDGSNVYHISYDGTLYCLRILTYLAGTLWHEGSAGPALYKDLGRFLGALNICLTTCSLPDLSLAKSRWDIQNARLSAEYIHEIRGPHYRRLVRYFLQQYEYQVIKEFSKMPQGLIHGDANDHNILVSDNKVIGLIDFGDVAYTHLINELAIALTYIMMESEHPMEFAKLLVLGYHEQRALSSVELEVLYYSIAARLCISLCNSSHGLSQDPDNKYLAIHQEPVKALLDKLITINPWKFTQELKETCAIDLSEVLPSDKLLSERSQHFSSALSVSYKRPITMVQGALQYLYDNEGNTFLDAVNNISHVGHCHPAVVEAASKQIVRLNTNTRYLYPQLGRYADMLCALLPEPLSVVFFTNSGTEANELALRLARTHTGNKNTLVVENAYHGNSAATIEISPYKYLGKGGAGKSAHIHQILSPDTYRGKYRKDDPNHLNNYLTHLQKQINLILKNGNGPATFISESILGCGGQIVFPPGYLKAAFKLIRESGGVCIIDEVQVGFGRVGTHFWGFQTQDVVPDIVTMGKPMGNGHPLAAVATTKEIARSFENGMEYFNSFGGNPVSCQVGMAVLSTIEEEGLQQNALRVGAHLKDGLKSLMDKHTVIGDVRGLGLFLGVELVLDRNTREPAGELTTQLVDEMKKKGVLVGLDGPFHNVIKIKPPLVISIDDADYLVDQLDKALMIYP